MARSNSKKSPTKLSPCQKRRIASCRYSRSFRFSFSPIILPSSLSVTSINGASNVVDVLIEGGIVSDVDVSRTLAAQARMDWIDISSIVIPPQVINQIRGEEARRFKVIPVGFGETGLVVAIGNPLDIDTIDSLNFLLQ